MGCIAWHLKVEDILIIFCWVWSTGLHSRPDTSTDPSFSKQAVRLSNKSILWHSASLSFECQSLAFMFNKYEDKYLWAFMSEWFLIMLTGYGLWTICYCILSSIDIRCDLKRRIVSLYFWPIPFYPFLITFIWPQHWLI